MREPSPPPEAERAGGTEAVLLVEDEPSVRAVVCEMLERQGYTVLVAGDGEEALAVWAEREGEIDVLATDVVMPRMDGRELAERLVPLSAGLRVLFLSGHTTDAAVREADGERRAFLPKPFTAAALDASLRRLLDVGGGAG